MAGRILVIGGGAAGMMAAITAARQGAPVTLAERNEKMGRKLYITGKGRCNVTNDCAPEQALSQIPRGNPLPVQRHESVSSSGDQGVFQ